MGITWRLAILSMFFCAFATLALQNGSHPRPGAKLAVDPD